MNIDKSIAKLQALCRAGDPVELRKVFASQTTLCGEGARDLVQDEAELFSSLKTVVEMTPELTIKGRAIRQLSADSYLTWLQWSSPTPDKSEILAFRSMTVWILEEGEWKIAGDMYGMGYFGAP